VAVQEERSLTHDVLSLSPLKLVAQFVQYPSELRYWVAVQEAKSFSHEVFAVFDLWLAAQLVQ